MKKKAEDLVLDGDILAAAKLMRDLDDEIPSAQKILKKLYKHTGHAYIIGVTGAPGGGKSTLVDMVTERLRKKGKSVGIVAIDPTSPFTGGAILGDRIRMQKHALDEGVFIKSLATRGHHGGLTRSTIDIVNVMDSMGKDVVIIETVGVGQDETEIVKVAHTNAVVLVPGLGDDIQAIKAGIFEIADIFVINKSDREGADRARMELETMIEMKEYGDEEWKPKICNTVATNGDGIDGLLLYIEDHRQFLSNTEIKRAYQIRKATVELMEILKSKLLEKAVDDLKNHDLFDEIVNDISEKKKDPYSVVEKIVDHRFAIHLLNSRKKRDKK
ncbi:MAG: methylmalonyl Co-A mutase-associated GTPase MeaB [Deltaproteobacteria bacterium]|nr:methylmalonyl Co-A mutase-associated GTPase MeaB [Deltaproteobacteria bacterium]